MKIKAEYGFTWGKCYMSRICSGVGGEIRHDIYSCYTRIAHRAQHNYRIFLRPPQSVISVLESPSWQLRAKAAPTTHRNTETQTYSLDWGIASLPRLGIASKWLTGAHRWRCLDKM